MVGAAMMGYSGSSEDLLLHSTTTLSLVALVSCGCASSMSSLGDDPPMMGPADAPVTILEFGDYQCSPCSRMGQNLYELLSKRKSEVRLLYRHCPARRHKVGRKAALVAAAAEALGEPTFWKLHWKMVLEGPVVDEDHIWELAREAGVEEARVRELLKTPRPTQRLEGDLALADRHGVRGMPTTFINGHRLEGTLSQERLIDIVAEVRGR